MVRNVKLVVPEEIRRDAGLPYEGLRDAHGIVLAIEGVNVTASVVTLVAVKQYAPQLVAAIRRWRFHQGDRPRTLTVTGPGVDLKIDLPPNISTQQLLRQLAPLLEDEPPSAE